MRPRNAFTLIEVMMSLLVSGIVLLAARAMLEAVADHARHIARTAGEAASAANGERTVRVLVENLDAGASVASAFEGSASEAHFTSWCDVPGGWREKCVVTIAVERDSTSQTIVARTSTGLVIALRSGFRTGALRYLASSDGGGVWLRDWGAGITAPLAIGIVTERDTLTLRIGERG